MPQRLDPQDLERFLPPDKEKSFWRSTRWSVRIARWLSYIEILLTAGVMFYINFIYPGYWHDNIVIAALVIPALAIVSVWSKFAEVRYLRGCTKEGRPGDLWKYCVTTCLPLVIALTAYMLTRISIFYSIFSIMGSARTFTFGAYYAVIRRKINKLDE